VRASSELSMVSLRYYLWGKVIHGNRLPCRGGHLRKFLEIF